MDKEPQNLNYKNKLTNPVALNIGIIIQFRIAIINFILEAQKRWTKVIYVVLYIEILGRPIVGDTHFKCLVYCRHCLPIKSLF
jgi:hypothetical protein